MKSLLVLTALFLSSYLLAQNVELIKIKSLRNKPIIQAEVNGKKGYFLIDTGSDISVINSSQLKRYKLLEKKIYNNSRTVQGFGHQRAPVMKVADVEVRLAPGFSHQQFYSLNLDQLAELIEVKTSYRIDGIIGADVLLKYNCIIDYNQRQITLVDGRSKKNFASR